MRKSTALLAGLLILLCAVTAFFLLCVERRTLEFQESTGYVTGPDRGIYGQAETRNLDRIRRYGALEGKERLRLLLLAFDLSEYSESEYIGEEKLQELDSALALAAEQNFGVIFRAAYGFHGGVCRDPEDFSRITNHIGQISAVLSRYADSLLCVQAGMLGPYGEWHSSPYTTGGSYNVQTHRVVTAWLEGLPETVEVALRRPSFVRSAILMGAEEGRLTVHNDALFSGQTDMDTYHVPDFSREDELAWLNSRTAVYMGGETTGCSGFSDAQQAIPEMEEMRLQYLNRYYSTEVWQRWSGERYHGQDAEEYILRHLGYRLTLEELTLTRLGDFCWIQMRIRNTGFGKLDDRVKFYLLHGDRAQTMENRSEREDVYIFRGFFRRSDLEEGNPGLCITRWDFGASDPENCIELANEEIRFDSGVNRIPLG